MGVLPLFALFLGHLPRLRLAVGTFGAAERSVGIVTQGPFLPVEVLQQAYCLLQGLYPESASAYLLLM